MWSIGSRQEYNQQQPGEAPDVFNEQQPGEAVGVFNQQQIRVSADVVNEQQNVQEHRIQQQQQQQKGTPRMEDALLYLDQIKMQFGPEVYTDFTDCLNEFQLQR